MNAGSLGQFASWLPSGGAPAFVDGEPDWLATERRQAMARALNLGIPTTKQEGWRYTALTGLIEQGFTPNRDGATMAPDAEAIERCLVPGLDSLRVLVINGRLHVEQTAIQDLPTGVRISGLRQVLDERPDSVKGHLGRIAAGDAHLFAALNMAAMDEGLVIQIDPGVRLERPIELVHLSLGQERDAAPLAQPHHLVILGEGAEATLIERFVGLDEASPTCTNLVVEVSLGRAAVLEHHRIQTEAPDAYHITALHVAQDAESRYRGINIGLGAAWARTDLVARFANEGAECDFSGLYLSGDRQVMDYHIDVDHAVPGCTSREHFKGILHGKGRAVFDGHVHVARDAQRSDAEMVNKNLLLSANAEIDAKPQLEIYADDVKCSHGTTVGQIEPDSLFYLRSRGIPLGEARRILCLAFADEILSGLQGTMPLYQHVSELVGATLDAVRFE